MTFCYRNILSEKYNHNQHILSDANCNSENIKYILGYQWICQQLNTISFIGNKWWSENMTQLLFYKHNNKWVKLNTGAAATK